MKRRKAKSALRRLNDWLHLWLGLSSGLVVCIVSITGCIYAFEKEIRDWTQPYQYVTPQDKPFLVPSVLAGIARHYSFGSLPDTGENRIQSIQYGDAGSAAIAAYQTREKGYTMVYLNPYNGEVLKEKILKKDFFRIILAGHFYFWLPPKIGQPLVATATLIFVVLLLTGLVMWWPKNLKKANVNKSFKLKWRAGFKRLNYDLHNVLGFYAMLVALVLGLTGMVWGFEWFNKSLYWVSSGGRSLPKKEKLASVVPANISMSGRSPVDQLWLRLRPNSRNEVGRLRIILPKKADDVFRVITNPDPVTYYKREQLAFDQYSLQVLPSSSLLAKKYVDASFADKLNRANYDIHVGAIWGLPGKLLAFFVSLICTSLPITGFLVWLGKRKKQRKPQQRLKRAPSLVSEQSRHLQQEPELV